MGQVSDFRCDKCGSRNHRAEDCAKPYNGWREKEPPGPPPARPRSESSILARGGSESAPGRAQDAPDSVLAVVLEAPRWRGGPEVCREANLPAFAGEKAAQKFHAANGGSWLGMSKLWRCEACGRWHYTSVPVGDNAVSGPLPKRADFPFFRDKTVAEMRGRGRPVARRGDLPQAASPTREVVKLARKPNAAQQGGLF